MMAHPTWGEPDFSEDALLPLEPQLLEASPVHAAVITKQHLDLMTPEQALRCFATFSDCFEGQAMTKLMQLVPGLTGNGLEKHVKKARICALAAAGRARDGGRPR